MGQQSRNKGEKKKNKICRKYPLTDRCMAVLSLEIPEVTAAKKPLLSLFSGLPIVSHFPLKTNTTSANHKRLQRIKSYTRGKQKQPEPRRKKRDFGSDDREDEVGLGKKERETQIEIGKREQQREIDLRLIREKRRKRRNWNGGIMDFGNGDWLANWRTKLESNWGNLPEDGCCCCSLSTGFLAVPPMPSTRLSPACLFLHFCPTLNFPFLQTAPSIFLFLQTAPSIFLLFKFYATSVFLAMDEYSNSNSPSFY